MDKPPIITYDFVTSQLKIIMASAIAYSLGKGWLNSADAGILASILTAVGSLAIPMIWAGASNWRTKKVPANSVAINPQTPADATAVIGANVAGRVVGLIALMILGALAFPGDASAAQFVKPTGNIVKDIATATAKPAGQAGSGVLNDILGALDDKLLPDLQYAKKMADASGSKVTAPCYQAWIDIITTRQKAVTNTDGSALELPNPRLITDFEKAVELRNALQPDSDFMRMCSPVANMIKQDMIAFIGKVLAGGAGLATLVPGL